jgi:glycerophosphoryl diester phosphodiesterase
MNSMTNSPPEIVAHRGNAADYPENTLPALRSALELGVRHVEFDVQLTSDRHAVLLHDDNLMRTTGVDRSVFELTAAELAELKANEAARFEGRYTDVGVPTLRHAADLLRAFPEATAFVEMKRASLRRFGADLMVRQIQDALGDVIDRCVLISFDLPAIQHARTALHCPVGWVLPQYDSLSALKSEALTPEYLFCDLERLPESGARLWRGPWRWVIYEVTSFATALALAARGVAMVETMQVRTLLRESRHARAARSSGT